MREPEPLVVPSGIIWEDYKREALEQLLYWLCDALGASDLEWRAGSARGTSRDRGRDLEATFHVPMPDGELRPEHWWLQAKGRASTVEPQAVREAAVEVQAHDEVDVLVVATNTRFSNDTRDWVAEFQRKQRRPSVRLWDRDALERMLVKHPSVVARVAPAALSGQGRLSAASSIYWNRHQLPSGGELDRFWQEREKLTVDDRAMLMLIVGEAGRNGLIERPWGAELENQLLFETLVLALLNLWPLLLRAETAGVEHEPLMLAVAHLIACALTRTTADRIVALLEDPWQHGRPDLDPHIRAELRETLIKPVVERLFAYLGTACMADCERLLGELEPEDRGRPEHRWLTLVPTAVPRGDVAPPSETLSIEKSDAPCRAGLSLTAEHGCPFAAAPERDWEELFSELRTVIDNRLAQVVATRQTHANCGAEHPRGEPGPNATAR